MSYQYNRRPISVVEAKLDAVIHAHEAEGVLELILDDNLAWRLSSHSKRFIKCLFVNDSLLLISVRRAGLFVGWYEYEGSYIKLTNGHDKNHVFFGGFYVRVLHLKKGVSLCLTEYLYRMVTARGALRLMAI